MLQHLTLFVDLDGVLANFDDRFLSVYGKKFDEFEEEEAWAKVKDIPNFWLSLELMPDAKELWLGLRELDLPIILLSSPGSHDEQRARLQKRIWVNARLGKDVPLILRRRSRKQEYSGPDSILIDDWKPTILEWQARGGHGIHHCSAEATLNELRQIKDRCGYLKWLSEHG